MGVFKLNSGFLIDVFMLNVRRDYKVCSFQNCASVVNAVKLILTSLMLMHKFKPADSA